MKKIVKNGFIAILVVLLALCLVSCVPLDGGKNNGSGGGGSGGGGSGGGSDDAIIASHPTTVQL